MIIYNHKGGMNKMTLNDIIEHLSNQLRWRLSHYCLKCDRYALDLCSWVYAKECEKDKERIMDEYKELFRLLKKLNDEYERA